MKTALFLDKRTDHLVAYSRKSLIAEEINMENRGKKSGLFLKSLIADYRLYPTRLYPKFTVYL